MTAPQEVSYARPMAITERISVNELIRDVLYSYAALSSDAVTQPLAAMAKAALDKLRNARAAQERADEAVLLANAAVDRAEYEIDRLVRLAELDALAETDKQRNDPRYRAVFPEGLSVLIAKWGAEQARAVRVFKKELESSFPALAKKFGKDLDNKANATEAAENAYRDACAEAGRTDQALHNAKTEVVRTLRKIEAGLLGQFPGQKNKVRTFFRKTRPKTRPAQPTQA